MRKIAFHTLGCKLNFAESSDLLRRFIKEGFTECSFHEKADVYVVNTCTVTAIAEKKGRNAIRQAHKLNPEALIAVIGCFAQVNAKEIEKIEGVGLILGNDNKHLLIDKVVQWQKERELSKTHPLHNCVIDISTLKSFYSSISFSDRTRGFLKVQDGCDYFCSYCEIPFARGRSRSCSIEQAVRDAEVLAKENKKEVVITGVNIGDFGKDSDEDFLGLIKALDKIDAIKRYRISSIEPNLLTKEIIDFCAESRSFMPHFHIPLQAGSNIVLKTMRRRYTREDFAEKVLYIKKIMPEAFIACDVMTGFNTESDKEFQSSYDFLKALPLAFIHVFTYSDRPDTKVQHIPDSVPVHIRKERSDILQKLAFEKKKEFYTQNIGYEGNVLWEESNKDGKMYGFTDNYIRVQRAFDAKKINEISHETLLKLSEDKEFFVL
ncbi:MAG: tRNA (N(6)-L-threonylcarbamoyladenosine(37)-C(2))-methylthiotransferase MtaB [Bacteroidales bacterium]|nr:tRNA (N(6)-L-threonylcarbamoyladenosine(37)-C(2))-methylthiotransferase MtaB [Bacteroidales bacterium]